MHIDVVVKKSKSVVELEGSLQVITLKPQEEIFYEVLTKKPIKSLRLERIFSLPTREALYQKYETSRIEPNKAYSFNLQKFIAGRVENLFEVKGTIIREEKGQFPLKKAQHTAKNLKISAEKLIQSKINKMQGEKPYTDMYVITYH